MLVPTLAMLALAPTASGLSVEQTDSGAGLKVTPKASVAKPKPKPKPVAVPPALESIAACESGGNPKAVSSTGQYRGKYQFDPGTWASVGGSGDPAAAPEAEQDRRAMMLYERSGPGQWPVCSQ